MKQRIFLMSLICLIPTIAFGGNYRIEELLSQKQGKIERLEKCQGTTKGLKIAGLSTLGITAVGVGVNVAEASKIKTNTQTINTTQQRITETQQEIDKKKAEIAEQQRQAELAKLNPAKSSAGTNETPAKSEESTDKSTETVGYPVVMAYTESGKCAINGGYVDDTTKCGKLGKGNWAVLKSNKDEDIVAGTSQCVAQDGVARCFCKKEGSNEGFVYTAEWDAMNDCKDGCAWTCADDENNGEYGNYKDKHAYSNTKINNKSKNAKQTNTETQNQSASEKTEDTGNTNTPAKGIGQRTPAAGTGSTNNTNTPAKP